MSKEQAQTNYTRYEDVARERIALWMRADYPHATTPMRTDEAMVVEDIRSELTYQIERRDAEIAKLRAALIACVDYWRDTEVPCPPDLHDQVTTALGGIVGQPCPE